METIPQQRIVYGDSSGKLEDQGISRSYYMYTPKSYNPSRPMPLVLVFHGDGGSGKSISDVSKFNEKAEQQGFIAVYPDGIHHRWHLGKNNPNNIDDISFVDNLISHLQQVRNIDSSRIYATGFSRGGILTQALACTLPDKFAAFASVAGSLPVSFEHQCQPQSPVSMLMINGTNDHSVLYQGDKPNQKGALASIPEVTDFWRYQNGCRKNDKDNNNSIQTYFYSGCNSGSEVVQLAVVNGGHIWYGGASNDESINKFNQKLGFNSTQEIWNFFERHSL
ncbi:phospholipase/carboxylesterase [Calothrix sp. NIES-4071]|nr:phospholipase/carboxylesterase [Calothrix sp. NIES-4071]BAZ60942.1 phospholipase/carboxylesterase [Calothrix sp. NIES-4105]